jgi:hypothetical protein
VIARRAEEATRSIAWVSKQEQALSCVAQALAWAGQHERAEATSWSIASPGVQAQALAGVAKALDE